MLKLLSLVLAASATGSIGQEGFIVRPPVAATLPAPPDDEQRPAARVTVADYRYNDILWENDRIAFRIYSRALEAVEPPSTSGIDVWGKNVRWPFMDRQLRAGDQHIYRGEGVDFYNVGSGRGAGGLGIWYNNKLWTSRNYQSVRILSSGDRVAQFEVKYAYWPVDLKRSVRETRRFTLPLGSNFTRMVSTIYSDTIDPLVVGIGIGRRTTNGVDAQITIARKRGIVSFWGPHDPIMGRIAVAVAVDPASIVDVIVDGENHLLLVQQRVGRPFVYYSGAAWSKGSDFHDKACWERYVFNQTFNFNPES